MNGLRISTVLFSLVAFVATGLCAENGFQKIGVIQARHANEITASNWSVGAETMDRDYTIFANWKKYLGPLGIKKARIQGGWAKTETEKGKYNWAWLDEISNSMTDQGVKPWVCLCYGNTLYSNGGGTRLGGKMPVSEDAMQGWLTWVKAMVTRYKDTVDEWEIWNEPQLRGANNTAVYTNLFIPTAEAIRSLQPDAKIIAMAMAGVKPELADAFLHELSTKNKLHLVDKITYHPYSKNPDSSYDAVSKLYASVRKFSDHITLFQGENGCPSEFRKTKALSGYPWTESSQAKWALRRMLGDLGRDIESSYFSICDMKYPDEINRKGLLKIDANKKVIEVKPAYYAIQNMVSIFDNTLKRIPAYPFKTNSKDSLSLFGYENTTTGYQAITVWIDTKIPSDENTITEMDFTFPKCKMDNPVYADLRTGEVYSIPQSLWKKHGTEIRFEKIPVYDSPIVLLDRSNVHLKLTGNK